MVARWILGVGVVWLFGALVAPAQRATLCVGIGAARISGDAIPWQSRVCAAARTDAEAAFRELVLSAASEPYLYAHSTRWPGPGVLLTDGVTDNQSIPVVSRILLEGRELVDAGGEVVWWLAGIGEVAGADSWLYDRMGTLFSISSLLNEMPPGGRHRVVLRAYPDRAESVANTLYICDDASAAALREWVAAGGRAADARRALPGLGWLLETMTSNRLGRLRDQLATTGDRVGDQFWFDLGSSVERVAQVVNVPVNVTEVLIYRKERKPGPFFTILEVDTDEVIGTDVQVGSAQLSTVLGQQQLAGPVINNVVGRVQAGAASSFEEVFRVGPTEYTVVYDKVAREVRLRYLD